MLRLQWELMAGEVEPLVDLVVMSVFPMYLALQRGKEAGEGENPKFS